MKRIFNLIKSNFGFTASAVLLIAATVASFVFMPECGILLLCITLVYISINFIYALRHGSDGSEDREEVRLSKLLSPAMYTAATPFAIISEDDKIFWRNKAFTDVFNAGVGASVTDTNTTEISFVSAVTSAVLPSAKKLADTEIRFKRLKEEKVFNVDFKDKVYRAYSFPCGVNSRYRGVLLTDITDIKDLQTESDNSSIIIAFVQIDNGAEIRESHTQFAQTSAKIEVFLQQWANSFNGFTTKDENGVFVIQFEKRYLKDMTDSKFEILDKVVSLSVGEELPLTISIGVSSANGSLQQRCDEAKKSLNKAYEGGGAKAVVAVGDGTYCEYGGKHKPFQGQSSIRARICKEKLKSAIENSSNVLIFGHKRPDFDSIASCIALSCFVRTVSKGTKPVKIVVDENEVTISRLMQYLYEEIGKGATEFENLFIDASTGQEENCDGTLLIVSDVSNPDIFESKALFDMVNTKFVIDHHSLNNELNVTYKYIDPSASSASEMVSEICELEFGQMQLGATAATILLSGILLDTNMFKRDAGPRTFAACRYLCKEGSDFRTASYWLTEENEVCDGFEKFETSDEGVYICVLDKESDPDNKVLAAKLSDSQMMIPGHTAVFTLYRDSDGISLSARSYKGYNVKSVTILLGGGGHFQAAGASLKLFDDDGNAYPVTDMEEAKSMVQKAVKSFKDNGHQ